jgi:hypothetical protein
MPLSLVQESIRNREGVSSVKIQTTVAVPAVALTKSN